MSKIRLLIYELESLGKGLRLYILCLYLLLLQNCYEQNTWNW